MNKIHICYAASSGGHTQELLQLEKLIEKYPGICITESSGLQNKFHKIYKLKQMNRKSIKSLVYFGISFFEAWIILMKEKPTHIISLGAMCTLPTCIIGKLLNIKVIYIESFARINDLSVTGKIIYRFADLFIVQWEQLTTVYKKAIYGGTLF